MRGDSSGSCKKWDKPGRLRNGGDVTEEKTTQAMNTDSKQSEEVKRYSRRQMIKKQTLRIGS